MKRFFLPTLAVGALLSTASFAQPSSDYTSQEGKWALNTAKSHHAAGAQIAKSSELVTTKDDGKTLQFTQSLTTEKGEILSISFDGAYDGKPHSMHNGSTMLFKHVSANTYRDSGKRLDGASWKETCTFSADHTTLSCKGADITRDGKTLPYVEVWNKTGPAA